MKTTRKHILVIDDEEEIRFMLETKFTKIGYQVSVAATAMQAIQKLKSGAIYDLIICDLKMPKMNGVDFFSEFKSLNSQAHFIMITGQPERDKLVTAMKKGIINIMIKPVKHADIIEKIQLLIGSPERTVA